MSLLALMWNALGLPQLGHFMSLRSAHFGVLTASDEDAESRYSETMKSLAGDIGAAGNVALLANAIAAESARGSAEIAATLLCSGVERALAAGLGSDLAFDLSLIAVATAHAYPSIHVDPFVEVLVGVGDGPNPLTERLSAWSDESVTRLGLPLVNAARGVKRPGLDRRVIEALRTRAAAIDDADEADEVAEHLDVYDVEAVLGAGDSVDVEVLLEKWKSRRERASYASVIRTLLRSQSGRDETVVAEAVNVLEAARADANFSSTAYVHLATSLDRIARNDSAAVDASVAYLRLAIHRWEHDLQIAATIAVFRILRRHYQDLSTDARLTHWEAEMHEHDRLEKLPNLIERGRFFILFQHYINELKHWELPAGFEPGGLYEGDGEAVPAARLVERWNATARRVPPPLVTVNGVSAVSLDFLQLGTALFGELEHDESFDQGREQLDQAAGEALRPLYEMVTAHGAIPAPIRSVLRRHQDFFVSQASTADA